MVASWVSSPFPHLVGFLALALLAAVAGGLLAGAWGAVLGTTAAVGYSLVQFMLVDARISSEPFRGPVDLTTDRLRIRRFERNDVAAFVASIDDAVETMNGWRDGTAAAAGVVLGARHDAFRSGHLVACEAATGAPVVFLVFSDVGPIAGAWNVGLHTAPQHRGQGLATEALTAAVELAHDRGIATLHMGTAQTNVGMRRAIEACGFVLTRSAPHTLPNGDVVPARWYEHTR